MELKQQDKNTVEMLYRKLWDNAPESWIKTLVDDRRETERLVIKQIVEGAYKTGAFVDYGHQVDIDLTQMSILATELKKLAGG